jgi:hypothetical protein
MRALQADGEEREALVAAWAIRATSTVPGNPARTIPTWVPAGASPRVRPLVGRERAEAELADLLRRENMRLVTLTGPGGVGKTSLALSVASTVCDEYPDGFVFVDLSSVRDSELVIAARPAAGHRTRGRQSVMAYWPKTNKFCSAVCRSSLAAAPWPRSCPFVPTPSTPTITTIQAPPAPNCWARSANLALLAASRPPERGTAMA